VSRPAGVLRKEIHRVDGAATLSRADAAEGAREIAWAERWRCADGTPARHSRSPAWVPLLPQDATRVDGYRAVARVAFSFAVNIPAAMLHRVSSVLAEVRADTARSVLKCRIGDGIELTAADFTLVASAFFAGFAEEHP
jgi:hypothetical protein